MNRSIQITSTDSTARKKTTTINYVNPNATESQLLNLSHRFIGLTTNTYQSATQIDKTALVAKVSPEFSISPATVQSSNINNSSQVITLNYQGSDRRVSFSGTKPTNAMIMQTAARQVTIRCGTVSAQTGMPDAVIKIHLEGNDEYEPAEATLTIPLANPQNEIY